MESSEQRPATRRARRVNVPTFVTDDDVGLGDVIKRATSAIGIRPCGGCSKRADWLNSRVRLGRERRS